MKYDPEGGKCWFYPFDFFITPEPLLEITSESCLSSKGQIIRTVKFKLNRIYDDKDKEVDDGQKKTLVEQVNMCSTFKLENMTTCLNGCTRQVIDENNNDDLNSSGSFIIRCTSGSVSELSEKYMNLRYKGSLFPMNNAKPSTEFRDYLVKCEKGNISLLLLYLIDNFYIIESRYSCPQERISCQKTISIA